MQVLFVHQSFPAQFGHIAQRLRRDLGWPCWIVSQGPFDPAIPSIEGVDRVEYKPAGGATAQTHYCSRTFENTVWHCDGVYETLKNRPDIHPDLIVGHSGFGSTLFLRELYPHVPVINLFEYFYHPHDSDGDMDFRRDLGWKLDPYLYQRSRCRNAMLMLDLNNCQLGYCPTQFQLSRFPKEHRYKLRTIFDGLDRTLYHGRNGKLRPPVAERGPRTLLGRNLPAGTKIVTYVARGMESMRGFDLFMQTAKMISRRQPDVVFFVVGSEGHAYGGDEAFIGQHKTFKEWVLAQDDYDLEKFHFVGWQSPEDLSTLLASTDLHLYWTVPFVLSWSMLNAMSCGAVVLGSSTTPVKEFITDGANGFLADFFNPQEFAEKAVRILQNPGQFRPLGRAAEDLMATKYSIDAVLPQMLKMYEDSSKQPAAPWPPVASTVTVETSNDDGHADAALSSDRATSIMSDGAVVSKVRSPSRSPFRG